MHICYGSSFDCSTAQMMDRSYDVKSKNFKNFYHEIPVDVVDDGFDTLIGFRVYLGPKEN